ncbi:hypothetical protein ACIQMR_35920 [Streptomyces sp. NPDC091376]|uniref:tetratricopeptide repeat protein n=1 Tax=Streptomyces sp. NPDC091376 TaxID=3365994 RepID=UPI00381163F3
MQRQSRELYEGLRALENRAIAARRAAGRPCSRRETERVLKQAPYGVALSAQRISTWLPDAAGQAQVPSPANSEKVWALIQVWSSWAGEIPDERYWRNLLDQAQPVRPPRTAQSVLGRSIRRLDPFALEVHRAIEVLPAAGSPPLEVLPAYVERIHDWQLSALVGLAADGVSGMAILVGGSSSGKTRACWQAVQALPDGWRLWHPFDPGRPEAAVEGLERVGPRTVIWLNESQHYFLTPANAVGERLAAGMRTLLQDPDRAPVLILGTLWPEYWHILTASPTPGKADAYAQARALLTGHDLTVADAFTDLDLDALRTLADEDPRLAFAAERAKQGQITQYLAGAPALIERYNNAAPAAKALISAAMDARRVGHGLALPRDLLEAAAEGYLTEQQYDLLPEEWFEQALAYATEPLRGACGPLTRIRPRRDRPGFAQPHYRLADFLDQHGHQVRHATVIPNALWNALTDHGIRADLAAPAFHAQSRGLLRLAFVLYRAAYDAGDATVPRRVAQMLSLAGRTEEATHWYRHAAEVALRESALAEGRPREAHREEVTEWLKDLWDPGADTAAVRLMAEEGGIEDALTWLRARAEKGNLGAPMEAARLLEGAGRGDEILAWYQAGAQAGSLSAVGSAARELAKTGGIEEALTWLRARTEVGGLVASTMAVVLLTDAGRTEEALSWYEARAERGEHNALTEAGDMLEEAGLLDEAITWYRRGIEAEDHAAREEGSEGGLPKAISLVMEAITHYRKLRQEGFHLSEDMSHLVEMAERIDDALTWLQRPADAAVSATPLDEANRLQEASACLEEAVTWLRDIAETGDPSSARSLGQVLAAAGRIDEALMFHQARTEAGEHGAAMMAVELLRRAGRTEEATSWLQRFADAGDPSAQEEVALRLKAAGRVDEAITWMQRAAEAGGFYVKERASRLMRAAGRTEDAIAWMQRRAVGGDLKCMREVARLLAADGHIDEAMAWMQRAAKTGGDLLCLQDEAELLETAGRAKKGKRLQKYGWELDSSIAQRWDAPLPET